MNSEGLNNSGRNIVVSKDHTAVRDENQEPSHAHNDSRQKLLNRVKSLGIPGAIVALAAFLGGIIGMSRDVLDFQQARPNLNISNPSAQLVPAVPALSDSPMSDKLSDLYYNKAPDLIDGKLYDLLVKLDDLDNSNDYNNDDLRSKRKEQLDSFKQDVDSAIKYYSQTFTDPTNKQAASDIVEELQKIKDDYLASEKVTDQFKVDVLFTVENRSKTSNIIQGKALLVAYDSGGRLFKLPLIISTPADQAKATENSTEQSGSEGKSTINSTSLFARPFVLSNDNAESFIASSQPLEKLGDDVKNSVENSWSRTDSFLLLIQDANGKTWHQEGRLSRIGVDEDLDRLESEANTLIQKEIKSNKLE